METVLLIARLILAVVFVVAGVAKAADPAGTRRAMIGFGIPANLAAPLGWGLVLVEIIVALALLPLDTAWLGGLGALALLILFAGAIGLNLARGQSPDCHCFGQIHSAPLSWRTEVRNLALAAIAAFIALRGRENPGMSAFDWLSDLKAGEIVNLVVSTGALILLTGAFVYLRKVISQQSTLLEKMETIKKLIDEDYAEPEPVEREDALAPVEGLPVGAPAPGFSLTSVGGQAVTFDDLANSGKPVLLLFTSPNCVPCKALLPNVKAWERDYSDQLTIALVSKGTLKENKGMLEKYGVRYLLHQGDETIAEDYQAKWTPAAVVISPERKIASQMTYGDDAIRALVNYTVTTSPGPGAGNGSKESIPQISLGTSLFKVGEPAPRFSLPDLNGRIVNISDLLSTDTLLLFWDPECRFCQAMSEDLKRLEENPPEHAPRVVLIASGKTEQLRKMSKDFKSLILLDPEFDAAPVFGSNSTPSAVLINSEGKISSSLAVGERNILALAGVRKIELPIASKR